MYEYTIIDTVEITTIIKREDEHDYKSKEQIEMDRMSLESELNPDDVKIKERKVFMLGVEE